MKNVVVVGGGTGTFTVLSGLKQYPYNLSAIVSMMDSGGSTGRLRDQFGVLPPGDVRQCLVALSDAPELWRKLFLYRFSNGDFKGHNFGNIFLTVLEKITDNYQEVIDNAGYILKTKGSVLPVTFDHVQLCAEYEDGETIETEKLIDTAFHKTSRIVKAYLKPEAKANGHVIEAITSADFIIIGPGDLYTSLVPNLIVQGVREAIMRSKAPIIMVANLMTKRGQTNDYKASDHVEDLEKYLGRKVKYVIINESKINEEILGHYAEHEEFPVEDDMEGDQSRTIIRSKLASETIIDQPESDDTPRSLVRHDPEKLSEVIDEIINKE